MRVRGEPEDQGLPFLRANVCGVYRARAEGIQLGDAGHLAVVFGFLGLAAFFGKAGLLLGGSLLLLLLYLGSLFLLLDELLLEKLALLGGTAGNVFFLRLHLVELLQASQGSLLGFAVAILACVFHCLLGASNLGVDRHKVLGGCDALLIATDLLQVNEIIDKFFLLQPNLGGLVFGFLALGGSVFLELDSLVEEIFLSLYLSLVFLLREKSRLRLRL